MKHSEVFAVMAVVFAITAAGFHDPITRVLSAICVICMVAAAITDRRAS